MHPEELFDRLEILLKNLPFNLPNHEDGGYLYPFAWNSHANGEFNIFNLFKLNNWIKPAECMWQVLLAKKLLISPQSMNHE